MAVDGDAEVRRTLGACLGVEGFDVVCAADGAEAERNARQGNYACLLINLRWQESLTLLRRLRPVLPTTPAILTTAIPDTPRREELETLGACSLLLKPLDLEELLSLLFQLTGGHP